MDTLLPPHVSLIAGPEVWMESTAVEQLVATASLSGCVSAVGLPDLHPGPGSPIGAAFLFQGRILPRLVGSDAGCGALLMVGRRDGPRGDSLERRVVHAFDEPLLPEIDRERLFAVSWTQGPVGLAALEGIPEPLAQLAARFGSMEGPSAPLTFDEVAAEQLGTIGGGNHFAEVLRVDQLFDRSAAQRAGLRVDAQAVLVHSGSRGLGHRLSQRWAGETLSGDAVDEYLAEQRGALRYASVNRLLIAWRLLRAAGLGSSARVAACIDRVHNGVEPLGEGRFLHRKGAAVAPSGEPTLVLGSRGAPSFVVEAGPAERALATVAHGAGRKLGRAQAAARLRARYHRDTLERTEVGCRVLCEDRELMYEEHPDAYKPIEPVVASLERSGAARRTAALMPLLTVKR